MTHVHTPEDGPCGYCGKDATGCPMVYCPTCPPGCEVVEHDDEQEEAEGCDCAELCEMGPTCPGGMLARLPGSGCWRTASSPRVTDEQLAEWEALADAATTGPWESSGPWERVAEDVVTVAPVEPFPTVWICRLGVGADSDADAAFIAASRVAVPALIAEVRALRETVARLNRRSQVAEAAIADLTREPIGGRKHKPVAAEVWTRCEESHGRGCRTTREAREEAERLRAEVERLRSEMAAKTADSALLLGFLGGAYDERDGARDGLVDLTARLAEQTRLTEQAREWAVRWQGEAERLRAGRGQ